MLTVKAKYDKIKNKEDVILMEILQLRYFCDAAETENFSKTAKKYNVPTSNISQTIQRLERELNVNLFNHGSNKITLNEHGKIFYINIKKALETIDEAKSKLSDSTSALLGEIKILCRTNRRIITGAIEIFKKQYPEINFLINHNAESPDDYDLIISDENIDNSKYNKQLIVTDEILIAMKNSNPLTQKTNLKFSDLKDECFISMPVGSSLYRLTEYYCKKAGFTPKITIQSDDPYYIRKYVQLGLGIALFPSISWKGQHPDGVILKNVGNLKRHTYIFTKNDRYCPKHVKLFLDVLSEINSNY